MIYGSAEDFRDFYASNLGRVTRLLLSQHIRSLWPDSKMMRVLGIGFAIPFLHSMHGEAERIVVSMPASQGAVHWPREGPGLVSLTEDAVLPFPDCAFDRVLVCHALEHIESTRALMRELWRILADDGRLLILAPNRQGIWARLEHTPFGCGRPFSSRQIKIFLSDALFTPLRVQPALFIPPFGLRLSPSWSTTIEKLGTRWFPHFSGVLLAEAAKRIYALPPAGKGVPARRRYAAIPSLSPPGGRSHVSGFRAPMIETASFPPPQHADGIDRP